MPNPDFPRKTLFDISVAHFPLISLASLLSRLVAVPKWGVCPDDGCWLFIKSKAIAFAQLRLFGRPSAAGAAMGVYIAFIANAVEGSS